MRDYSLWVFLPPVYSLCTAVGLWVVYFIAVHNEKIVPLSTSEYRRGNGSLYAPYISNAGNFPPASCIFSWVMNLAAFVGFIIVVLRYLQLRRTSVQPWLNILNLVAFSLCCFGMTLIGNFQLFAAKNTHNSGTFMTFGLGMLFCWMQSYITLRVNLQNEGKIVSIVRFLLSGTITLCMILYFSLMPQKLHMHAARCQWALVMFFLIFLATFAVEFRHNRFRVVCTDNNGPSETNSEVYRQQPD